MKENAHIFVCLYQIHAQTCLKRCCELLLCLIFKTGVVGDEGGRKKNLKIIYHYFFLKDFFVISQG